MPFLNSEVDMAALPAVEAIVLQPVNKNFLTLLRMEWFITSLCVAIITALLIYFIPEFRHSFWWIALIFTSIFFILGYYIIQERSFLFMAYAVREEDVIYQKGWLVRSTKVCPYNRVQNCSIKSGPLERKRGLASLILYTAGSEGADMRIPGLLQTDAEELRQFILSKINGTG